MSLFWDAVKRAELKLPFRSRSKVTGCDVLMPILGISIPYGLPSSVLALMMHWDVDKDSFYPINEEPGYGISGRKLRRMVSLEDPMDPRVTLLASITPKEWNLIHEFHRFWDTLEDCITFNFPLLLSAEHKAMQYVAIPSETSEELRKIVPHLDVIFPTWPERIPC